MKKNGHKTHQLEKAPAFVARAERALQRVARNVQTENRAFSLPLLVWKDGKLVERPA